MVSWIILLPLVKIDIMNGIGSILKSHEEIEERKAIIAERDKNRKTPDRVKAELIAWLKKDEWRS